MHFGKLGPEATKRHPQEMRNCLWVNHYTIAEMAKLGPTSEHQVRHALSTFGFPAGRTHFPHHTMMRVFIFLQIY